MNQKISPEKIFKVGLGFWDSKVLLSAVELGLFTELATSGPLEGEKIKQRLQLHDRSYRDFLDSLVAMGFLQRKGSTYSNSPETDLFLDKNKPSYMGGILEMCNARLFKFWNSLTEALKTGEPQNEAKTGGDIFAVLYADPDRLKGFLKAMTGLSRESGNQIAEKFPWKDHQSFIDIGAAQGAVPVQIALAHKHLQGGGFDLPAVGPIFEEYIASHALSERVKFFPGNFMKDPLPKADVLIMGHILHDWNLAEKKMLLQKAYNALPNGGALIIHEAIIDDERRENTFGLLMSLNMLIETPGGFDFTAADCLAWMKEAGFREGRVEPLSGPNSMVIGIK